MFRRNKTDKTKLEHKLYLARENPEPIFDLSECDINSVPKGVFSLCRVFRKEKLYLQKNLLNSLSGGGSLKDLCLIKVLDISNNTFVCIPDEIEFLVNLTHLHANDNQLKKLPPSLCNLKNLTLLDISTNFIKILPDNIGNLNQLQHLNICCNKSLNSLPKNICQLHNLKVLQLEPENFIYPPKHIVDKGVDTILQFICNDCGIQYMPKNVETSLDNNKIEDTTDNIDDNFKDTIWKIEKIKEERTKEFLKIEKANELLQKQEFELATASRANREKLLLDITQQQSKLDIELYKIQQLKDFERFRLIEQLQEAEQNASRAINQLISLNKEPLRKFCELEKIEEERLLLSVTQYNEALKKEEILIAMQELFEQETEQFKFYSQNRWFESKSLLEKEAQMNWNLTEVLQKRSTEKQDFLVHLQENEELQKTMVGTLLEKNDSRSWGLVQQVRLVESQLAALTAIELNKRKLIGNEQLINLIENRQYLSKFLTNLLEQQDERRSQLLITLKSMEEQNSTSDFWLKQYQQLLKTMPATLTQAQKNLDPELCESLLLFGMLNYLPFLAKLVQTRDILKITKDDIRNAGIDNESDVQKIVESFQTYSQGKVTITRKEIASAPPLEQHQNDLKENNTNANECVICMDSLCEVIFLPCGHFCSCNNCSETLTNCPMCRNILDKKIRVYL